MGAMEFFHVSKGKTAKEAFDKAVAEALYDYGHAGYTGTIAEKTGFTMIECPKGVDPDTYAARLINEGDQRVDDKWGPAGCIKMKDGEYLFFGWASS